jgi:hypothetical protein
MLVIPMAFPKANCCNTAEKTFNDIPFRIESLVIRPGMFSDGAGRHDLRKTLTRGLMTKPVILIASVGEKNCSGRNLPEHFEQCASFYRVRSIARGNT